MFNFNQINKQTNAPLKWSLYKRNYGPNLKIQYIPNETLIW